MRSELVVRSLKGAEHALLQIAIRRRQPDRAGFEGAVQALMRSVFLRAPGRDALVRDAELEPPDVEAIQTVNARGGERRAVVTPETVLD